MAAFLCEASLTEGRSRGYRYRQVVRLPVLIAMLRIGTKYQISHLREDAVLQLKEWFPLDLVQFSKTALWPIVRKSEDPAVPVRRESIALVDVLRECNLEVFLPLVFYQCAQLDVEVIVEGYTDSDGERWKLSRADVTRCIKGQQWLHSRYSQFLNRKVLETVPTMCTCHSSSCLFNALEMDDVRKAMVQRLNGYQENIFTHPKHYLAQHLRGLDAGMCSECSKKLDAEDESYREEIWKGLASHFDVPVIWPVASNE